MRIMLLALGLAAAVHGPAAVAQAKRGHVAVNGLNYYYEVHGRGEPLLLLHGGLGSIDMLRPVLPTLAKNRRVIAVDLLARRRGGVPARRAAPRDGAPPRAGLGRVRAGRLLSGDAADAGAGGRGHGPEHIVRFYQLLGGGLKDAGWGREHLSRNRLAILPDLTHYDIFLSPELPRTVLPFLDGKSAPKSWAGQADKKK